MAFQPLTNVNYQGHEHVLNGVPCFVHPGNGNSYGIDIDKVGGLQQNLNVYRTRPGSTARELVRRYVGGADSAAQIAAGGCVILQDGSLEVWASAVPPSQPNVTKTGFQGVWDRIPNVDAPWSSGGGSHLFDAPLTSSQWDGRAMPADSGVAVDIPSTFGAPAAQSYLIRFIAVSDAPDVRVRAGRVGGAPDYLTMNSQVAGIEMHIQGHAPGPQMYISTARGPAQVWLRVLGLA